MCVCVTEIIRLAFIIKHVDAVTRMSNNINGTVCTDYYRSKYESDGFDYCFNGECAPEVLLA